MDRAVSHPAELDIEDRGDAKILRLSGDWVVDYLADIDGPLRRLGRSPFKSLVMDLSGVGRMDTAGAFLVHRTVTNVGARGGQAEIAGLRDDFSALLEAVADSGGRVRIEPEPVNGLLLALDRVGRAAYRGYAQAVQLTGLTGHVLYSLARSVVQPGRLRIVSLISHAERAGLDAVPIVSLLTFLIGAVMAFLGARTLQAFGAQIFVVELVSIGVLRELGVILAAIITAGRSGSAFTAEIGSMKANEEIDAMRTLGIDPVEVLVVPRVLAFVFMLPILTFIGDVMGIFGGMLVSWAVLDVSPAIFFSRMVEIVPIAHFWVGLIKAPFFAWSVAIIGCQEGLNVEGSAESVGRHTTRSVVQAIFAVIVIDAVFAMLFMEINY